MRSEKRGEMNMPWGDGTGPWWARRGWNCRRFGMGRGHGPGFRNFSADYPDDDPESLKRYADDLKAELDSVMKRLASLRKK